MSSETPVLPRAVFEVIILFAFGLLEYLSTDEAPTNLGYNSFGQK